MVICKSFVSFHDVEEALMSLLQDLLWNHLTTPGVLEGLAFQGKSGGSKASMH